MYIYVNLRVEQCKTESFYLGTNVNFPSEVCVDSNSNLLR